MRRLDQRAADARSARQARSYGQRMATAAPAFSVLHSTTKALAGRRLRVRIFCDAERF